MAGKSKVGSLYYEVLLDPSGFARGATKVRKEQKMLLKSIEQANNKIAKSDKQLKDEYKRNMLERVANLRKLQQAGQISQKQFQELYAGEARMYKHFQDEMLREGIRAQEKRNKMAMDALKKRNKMRQEERDAIYKGDRGLRPMFKEHMARISQAGVSGGTWGKMNQVANSMQMMFMKFWPFLVGWQILKGVVGGIVRSFWGLIKAADERQRQTNIMTSLFGSVEEAKRVQRQLIDYAKRTSFGVTQTMELSNQLVALGYSANEAVESIELFGNLSFGDPYRLRLIAKAFSDVKAQGKLMMTEIRQFANQNVPLLDQLSLNLNKSVLEIRQMVTDGLIDSATVKQALTDISKTYGDTAGAMMDTATGQWERLKESAGELAVKIGGPLSYAVRTGLVEPLADAVSYMEELSKDRSRAPGEVDEVGAAVGATGKFFAGPLGWISAAADIKGMFERAHSVGVSEVPGVRVPMDIGIEVAQLLHTVSFGLAGMSHEAGHSIYVMKAMNEHRKRIMEQEAKERSYWLVQEREYRERMEAWFPWSASEEYSKRMGELALQMEEVGLDAAGVARLRYKRELDALLLQEKINETMYNDLMAEYDRVQAAKGSNGSGQSGTMASLPSDAFRQNSVEEFRYLEAKRSEAYRNQLMQQNTAAINANTNAIQNMPISTGGSGVVQATSGGSV